MTFLGNSFLLVACENDIFQVFNISGFQVPQSKEIKELFRSRIKIKAGYDVKKGGTQVLFQDIKKVYTFVTFENGYGYDIVVLPPRVRRLLKGCETIVMTKRNQITAIELEKTLRKS